jgi:hypothetical protein
MPPNPFTFGNPIRDPRRFIGRQSDLQQIVDRLRSSAHESTSVVGERRIGKTSLLKYLDHKDAAAELGLPAEDYCLVYMDFQGLADITPQRFWQRVLQKIKREICHPDLIPLIEEIIDLERLDLFDLEDLFTSVGDKGLTVALLLDEFEYVTQNPNFGSDFFGALRALAIHHGLPLVTSTRRELVDLCHSEEIKGSPFFNIFANLVLRPFNPAEVDELITTYLGDTDIEFTEPETELVMRLGGGYPFFTQIACHYVYETKTQGVEGEALAEQVTRAFEGQVAPHYQYMWKYTNESEKLTLLAVMNLNRAEPGLETRPSLQNLAALHSRAHLDVPELLKRGLLIENEEAGTYQLLSPNLADWITREILAFPGEEAPETVVRAWLAAQGGGSSEVNARVLSFFKEEYWPLLTNFPGSLSEELTGKKELEAETERKTEADLSQSVFICYSREDKPFVDQLVADLQPQGVQTWRDVDDITHTSRSNQLGWRSAIENALDHCAALIIVLSPGAVDSPEVQAEWNHFASYKRPIYPVVARTCKVPFYLKIYQIWDLTAGYEDKLSELAGQLQEVLISTGE